MPDAVLPHLKRNEVTEEEGEEEEEKKEKEKVEDRERSGGRKRREGGKVCGKGMGVKRGGRGELREEVEGGR